MKTKQNKIIIGLLIICIILIIGFVFLDKPIEKIEFIGYVDDNAMLEKVGDDTYRTTIFSSPVITPDGREIDSTWKEDNNKYISGHNIFSVIVNQRDVNVEALYNFEDIKKGEEKKWSPRIYLNNEEVFPVSDDPVLTRKNVLEWDYIICKRELRLIEGGVIEVYLFEEDPNGDIKIRSGNVGDLEPSDLYAIDGIGNPLESFEVIDDAKIVKAEDFKKAVYPVIIDDSFASYSGDGYLLNRATDIYSEAWNQPTAYYKNITSHQIFIGEDISPKHTIYRGYFYFDTSAIPIDVNIISAKVNLIGTGIIGENNFEIQIQNGQPDYPYYPLRPQDFNRLYYSGSGGTVQATEIGFDSNIEINLANFGWINKGGITKFILRSNKDIAGQAHHGIASFYSQDNEPSKQPKLIIEYETAPSAVLVVSPTSLDFGSIPENSSKDMTLTISNTGAGPLSGTISVPNPFISFDGSSFSINPSSSEDFIFRFSPTSQGTFNKQISITSNGGNKTINISGVGTASIEGCIPEYTTNDYIISSNSIGNTTCVIQSGGTEGINNGDIIIRDITIQMNSNTELIFNDGESIKFDGSYNGKIAKSADNSVIKKGVMPSAPTCTNQCSPSGTTQNQCSGGWVQRRTCGNYDSDTCLEWSSWSNITNCNSSDGCVGTTYRDYYCSGGSCTYTSSYNDSRCIDLGPAIDIPSCDTYGVQIGTRILTGYAQENDILFQNEDGPTYKTDWIKIGSNISLNTEATQVYAFTINGNPICTSNTTNIEHEICYDYGHCEIPRSYKNTECVYCIVR